MKIEEFHRQVGQVVRAKRRALGITQKDLASSIGLDSHAAVSMFEQGKRDLSLFQARLIAQKLEIAPAELLEPENVELPAPLEKLPRLPHKRVKLVKEPTPRPRRFATAKEYQNWYYWNVTRAKRGAKRTYQERTKDK
jgi:transcriptional regulator with XRE-family HTH domain